MNDAQRPDFSADNGLAGFRLERLEVFNWGTFDGRVWTLHANGRNALLTGDIGSGKSTLVDAVTTLLVPAHRVAYNKAAGADARERTLRSYVLGHYKSERNDSGGSAKPVALRDRKAYTVILGVFRNTGYDHTVTLAQVFWQKETQAQPARFFTVAERDLSIAKDFADFGTDTTALRKRLRNAGVEIFDGFKPYGAHFRRRLGIESEQALELFHQTVSMKSVGNLTEFVRSHMLEPFDVEPRVKALIEHFDDLNRAHEAVLKAKAQVERLTPLVEDCDRHAELVQQSDELRACRDALKPYFAHLKLGLLDHRLENLNEELTRLDNLIERLEEKKRDQRAEEFELHRTIVDNGGDRIERIAIGIEQKEIERKRRLANAERYGELVQALNLSPARNVESFLKQRKEHEALRESQVARETDIENHLNETHVEFIEGRRERDALQAEIDSLKARRSNIDKPQIAIRTALCDALRLPEGDMPFAGELIQVRDDEKDWEGAAERLLRGFGQSLLVPDKHYEKVADWVDRNHLRGRLVYFRVRDTNREMPKSLHPDSLVRKLAVKPESQFYDWLERELAQRFDFACCTDQEQFRREIKAITVAGQIKAPGGRHEKDDRYRIDDRSRYVLGWDNAAKIAALDDSKSEIEEQLGAVASRISALEQERKTIKNHLEILNKLHEHRDFRDLDWQPLAAEIADLHKEKRELETASDRLATLTEKLQSLQKEATKTEETWRKQLEKRAATRDRKDRAEALIQDTQALMAESYTATASENVERIDTLRAEILGPQQLTVESCDNREQDMRKSIQERLDAEAKKLDRLREKIVRVMADYKNAYELDTQDVDTGIEAAFEYRTMLENLRADDLPRFEKHFKELLNENTIREVANFQSQLARERETIKERIERINESLTQIEYNPGRYIVLEHEPASDVEIRDFHTELRACTDGALTGSDDEQYSETKFLQVKRIIERFRGREGQAEADRRWRAKVTDVRNWFVFAASERWREDDKEHEHYSDSGGKSGGQKEKLAYTILAASLAYQFGLEWGVSRSRTFRFVVIDEAFGRGSDESAQYGLQLFQQMNLQLLIVTPLQKIHIIEPFVASVGFVHNEDGRASKLRNLCIEEYQAEKAAHLA